MAFAATPDVDAWGPDDEPTGRPYRPPRPWCFACREDGNMHSAQYLGIACEWHFEGLPLSDQEALREAIRRRHPRGGGVRTVIEQLVVVRMDLRTGDIPNTVEKEWAADRERYFADIADLNGEVAPSELGGTDG